ncbi:hypothetical protein [Micromonospora rifamycinica]|uniref:hypothetical protein n=1 Tax=Micromonospora rifamycinica TaxID=291594 RepID=UPI000A066F1D|nr:hypothetical protein [Micromonospora rifamycinica]
MCGGNLPAGRGSSRGTHCPRIAELCEPRRVSVSAIRTVFVRRAALEAIDRHQGKGVHVTDPATWLRRP